MTDITSFTIPDLTTLDVAEVVADALRPMPGVADVVVNLPARVVNVEYERGSTTPDALRNRIERAGYLVQRYSDGRR